MQKKLALSFLMAGLISTGYTSSVQAANNSTAPKFELYTYNNLLAAAIAGLLSPYMYKYWTKEDPQTRYDLDELKNGQNVLANLYYFFIDGFNGTPEINEAIKLKGENGKELTVELKAKRPATGVIGKIHANHKNMLTTAGFLAAIFVIVNYETVVKYLPTLVKILKDSKDGIDVAANFITPIPKP